MSDVSSLLEIMLRHLQKKQTRVLITIDDISKSESVQAFAHSFQSFVREGYPVFLLMTGLYENISDLENTRNLTFLLRTPKIQLKSLNLRPIAMSYRRIFKTDDENALKLAKLTMGYAYGFQLLGSLLSKNGTATAGDEIIDQYDIALEDNVYGKIWESASENECIEYKKSSEQLPKILKTLCAFGNNYYDRDFQYLFIGVDELNDDGAKAVPALPICGINEEYDLLRKFSNFHFSSVSTCGATIDDLSADCLSEYILKTSERGVMKTLSKSEMAKSLKLTDENGGKVRNFAILMFAEKPDDWIPYSYTELILDIYGTKTKMESKIFNERDTENPEIRDVFKDLGIIESFGTGIGEAKKAMADNGSSDLYYKEFDSASNVTSVVIPVNADYLKFQNEINPKKNLGFQPQTQGFKQKILGSGFSCATKQKLLKGTPKNSI